MFEGKGREIVLMSEVVALRRGFMGERGILRFFAVNNRELEGYN